MTCVESSSYRRAGAGFGKRIPSVAGFAARTATAHLSASIAVAGSCYTGVGMPESSANQPSHRRGAVAIIVRDERLLVIRRSHLVVAPGAYCFPGGGIEGDESETEALVREIEEELGVPVVPRRRIWSSVTPWDVHLAWWRADLAPHCDPRPNPAEVESIHWHTPSEMAQLPELLESNRRFLEALARGEFALD